MNKSIVGLAIIGLVLWLLLKGRVQQISNEEVWTWTDWQGRERTITVHRNVKGG